MLALVGVIFYKAVSKASASSQTQPKQVYFHSKRRPWPAPMTLKTMCMFQLEKTYKHWHKITHISNFKVLILKQPSTAAINTPTLQIYGGKNCTF